MTAEEKPGEEGLPGTAEHGDTRGEGRGPVGEPGGSGGHRGNTDGAPVGEPSDPDRREGRRRRPSPWGNDVGRNHGQVVAAGRIEGGVHYHEHIGAGITRRLRQTATVGEDRIKEVRNTFCTNDPEGYANFLDELRADGAGVVLGRPGSGRVFTAVHALASVRLGASIEELTVDPKEGDAGVHLINVDSDDSRLLDLTQLPFPSHTQQVALRGLVVDARRAGAALVFVAEPESAAFLADLRARWRIDAPARAVDVFRRAMSRACDDEAARVWLEDARVRDALEGAEPARAISLAREARRRRDSFSDRAAWIERVLQDHVDNSDDLAGWFRNHALDTEFQRVLLATVALLEGGPRGVIVHHSRGLARTWHVPPLWRTPISGDGLTSHLWEIRAHVREGGIYFNRPQAADEALDYLWREHPETRDLLKEWVPEAVASLDSRYRLEAARRWLRLARRHRDFSPVRMLLEEWGDAAALMWEAIPAVAEAAVSPEFGPQVRLALYNVARSPGVRLRDRTVLEVCRVYGRVQPATALTRLRHIAEKVPAYWDGRLFQALEDIATETENTGIVLESLVEWVDGPRKGRAAAVAGAALCRLLALGDEPGPRVIAALRTRELVRESVVSAWCAAASCETEVGRALWVWLDALSDRRDASDVGFETLRVAARAHEPFRRSLQRWLNRWRHAHPYKASGIDDLWRIMNEERQR